MMQSRALASGLVRAERTAKVHLAEILTRHVIDFLAVPAKAPPSNEWSISHTLWNKFIHALNGEVKGGGGSSDIEHRSDEAVRARGS